MKNKKILRNILIIIVVLLVAFGVFIVVDNMAFMARYKKENSLSLFSDDENGQNFYILGTIHGNHFDQSRNYSLADIQSTIETVDPDIILLEFRPETYANFNNTVDGPAEMIYVYSYATENGISVAGIDNWEINENAKSNSTTDERDDAIFNNIKNAAKSEYKTILIIVGRDHLEFQEKRFLDAGYEKQKIKDVNMFYANADPNNFKYPNTMIGEIDKKAEFYGNGILEEIGIGIPSNEKAKIEWENNAKGMVDYLNNDLKPLVEKNLLFIPSE